MKNRGQNLMEFGIIIAVIAIASILVLTVLGSNINSLFSSSKESVDQFQPFGKGTASTIPGSNNPILIEGDKISYDENGNLTIKLDDLEISNIPGDFYQVLQTAGSSGGTKVLADVISELADYLAASGKMPEEDVQVLQDMASKANQMADIEAQIEELSRGVIEYCATQPNGQACNYTDYYTNGGPELVTQLAGEDGNGGLNEEFRTFINSPDFDTFKQTYPETAILIELLHDEISAIAYAVEINDRSLGDNGYMEDGKVRIFNALDIVTPGFDNPSKITDIDGALICQVGNGSYNPDNCD